MKKTLIVLIMVTLAVLMVSCVSSEPVVTKSQLYPLREAGLDTFPASRYSFVGNISGTGTFDSSEWNPAIPPCGEITSLESTYIKNRISTTSSNSTFGMAMDAALYELETKADELGVAFLIFPRYNCEFVDEKKATVKVTAIGVKLVNEDGVELPNY